MYKRQIILSIAGSDCSGGAGIQADIKTISALGGYAASVIAAVTAQNTLGVQSVYPIPGDMVKAQITSVMDDLRPDAVKIGMVYDACLLYTSDEGCRCKACSAVEGRRCVPLSADEPCQS